MKNLINFFFSFDKLMKEKLVTPFYWLSIILGALYFSTIFLETIWLGPLAKILNVFTFFVAIVFSLVGIRLLCELMVAIFRINNNLSPDGGKSETADIDPMVEARKAAEAAAVRAREVTKTAGEKASAATKTAVEKTKHAADSAKDSVGDAAGNAVSRTKTAAKSAVGKAELKAPIVKTTPKTTSAKKPTTKRTATNQTTARKTTNKKTPVKKKPTKKAPAKKTTARKSPVKKTVSSKRKPGPKTGTKARRDSQGRLLKKDGTPRKKPGPKKS